VDDGNDAAIGDTSAPQNIVVDPGDVQDFKREALDEPAHLETDIGFELGRAVAVLDPHRRWPAIPRTRAEMLAMFQDLAADAELIWVVACYGDHTLTDEEVLSSLRRWNDRHRRVILAQGPD
jgi:hypothetical protein